MYYDRIIKSCKCFNVLAIFAPPSFFFFFFKLIFIHASQSLLMLSGSTFLSLTILSLDCKTQHTSAYISIFLILNT